MFGSASRTRCARSLSLGAALALGVAALSPAGAAGILDAACGSLDQKQMVTDYKGAPGPTSGRGHGVAAFVRGKDAAQVDTDYLMLVWSKDSGQGDGGISFWNWNSPSSWADPPKLKFKLTDPKLREAHSTPVTNMFPANSPTTVRRTWVAAAPPTVSPSTIWTSDRGTRAGQERRGPPARRPPTTAAAPSGSSPWRLPTSTWPRPARGSRSTSSPTRPMPASSSCRIPTQKLVRSPREPGVGARQPHRGRCRAGQLRRHHRGHQQPGRAGDPEAVQSPIEPAHPQRLWLDAQRQHPLRRGQAAGQSGGRADHPRARPGNLAAQGQEGGHRPVLERRLCRDPG